MNKIKKFFQFLKDESITDILEDGIKVFFNIVIAVIYIAVAILFVQELIKAGIINDVIRIVILIILILIGIFVLIFILGLIKKYFDKRFFKK